jgi:hypothetical protein
LGARNLKADSPQGTDQRSVRPMAPLDEQVEGIATREDLAAFVETLRRDLEENPKQWENPTLATFLGALGSWIEDMDGFYRHHGREVAKAPTWKTIGEMLAAARIYE